MRVPQMSQEDHNSSSQPAEPASQFLNPRASQNSFASNESRRSRTNANPPYSPSLQTENSAQYNQARQPINDAVASAFNNAESPLSPELLSQITSQITQNVLQQLKVHPLPTPAVPQGASASGEQPEATSSVEGSPPTDRAKLYTPPSPYRAAEEAAQTHSSPRMRARTGQPVYGEASPPKRDLSPFSQSSQAYDTDTKEAKPTRPPGPKRISTGGDTTVLEKIWGKLYDPQGQPTVRLGQFLRGIAVHLIEDYEPKHSLVITPTKMQKYYDDTRATNEIYPWQLVFDDRTSSISRLFRELGVQHHLVQDDERFDQRPDIPGLTPNGFETWATLLLRAHPDQEFERLAKTALDMPINNPDDMKERFPKELSRRQFPSNDDAKAAFKLQRAMATHCNVNPSRNNSSVEDEPRHPRPAHRASDAVRPPPGSTASYPDRGDGVNPPASAPPGRESFPNIERVASAPVDRVPHSNPASNAPSEAAIEEEEEDNAPTPHPIERERKPYVANPGGGKTYEVESHSADEKPTEIFPGASADAKIKRSGSVSSNKNQPRSNPIAIHQNGTPSAEFADLSRARSYPVPPHKDPPQPRTRNRSPSLSKTKEYRRAESDVVYGSSYHSTSSHDGHRPSHADRYAHRAQSIYEPHDHRDRGFSDRERESRPRFQSMSASDANHYVPPSHDYNSSAGSMPSPYGMTSAPAYAVGGSGYAQYPPNAYRDGR